MTCEHAGYICRVVAFAHLQPPVLFRKTGGGLLVWIYHYPCLIQHGYWRFDGKLFIRKESFEQRERIYVWISRLPLTANQPLTVHCFSCFQDPSCFQWREHIDVPQRAVGSHLQARYLEGFMVVHGRLRCEWWSMILIPWTWILIYYFDLFMVMNGRLVIKVLMIVSDC